MIAALGAFAGYYGAGARPGLNRRWLGGEGLRGIWFDGADGRLYATASTTSRVRPSESASSACCSGSPRSPRLTIGAGLHAISHGAQMSAVLFKSLRQKIALLHRSHPSGRSHSPIAFRHTIDGENSAGVTASRWKFGGRV